MDARFDLPGFRTCGLAWTTREKFLAVALSAANPYNGYQNAPPVVKKPVQAASSSVQKKLAHISRLTQPPLMPMTKKEKKAGDKLPPKKGTIKRKLPRLTKRSGRFSRSRKRVASVTPGDEVFEAIFNIIRGDGSIDHTWRNVLFLVTFSFLSLLF